MTLPPADPPPPADRLSLRQSLVALYSEIDETRNAYLLRLVRARERAERKSIGESSGHVLRVGVGPGMFIDEARGPHAGALSGPAASARCAR